MAVGRVRSTEEDEDGGVDEGLQKRSASRFGSVSGVHRQRGKHEQQRMRHTCTWDAAVKSSQIFRASPSCQARAIEYGSGGEQHIEGRVIGDLLGGRNHARRTVDKAQPLRQLDRCQLGAVVDATLAALLEASARGEQLLDSCDMRPARRQEQG